jgi:hypothetical protein
MCGAFDQDPGLPASREVPHTRFNPATGNRLPRAEVKRSAVLRLPRRTPIHVDFQILEDATDQQFAGLSDDRSMSRTRGDDPTGVPAVALTPPFAP